MQLQQLATLQGRSLVFGPGSDLPGILPYGDRANTLLGFDANGDPEFVIGTDGLLAALLASTAGAGLLGATQALDYIAGTLGARFNDTINPRDRPYLAVSDGVTDCTAAFQSAINDCISKNKTLSLTHGPEGSTFYFAQNSAPLDPGTGLNIRSELGVVLKWHEGTVGTPKRLFYNDLNTAKKSVRFDNVSFEGTFGARTGNQGGQAVFLDHYEGVEFYRCRWQNTTHMATDLHFNGYVVWRDCVFDTISRDAARARDCFHVNATGNTFFQVGDDCLAWHNNGYVGGYNPAGSPRREGFFASHNFFSGCSGGAFSALGARVAHFTDNICLRMGSISAVVYINQLSVFNEGPTPIFDILVESNTILDCVSVATVIQIQQTAPRGATGLPIPGDPTPGTGTFLFPWDYREADAFDPVQAVPPMARVKVRNNTIARTLPNVATYSLWGFGRLMAQGVLTNPVINDAAMRSTTGIFVSSGTATLVDGNYVASCVEAYFLKTPQNDTTTVQCRITRNTAFDCHTYGIRVDIPSVARKVDVLIADNALNLDPYRKNANSLANGAYTAPTSLPFGVDCGFAAGVTVCRTRFQNVGRMINTANPTGVVQFDNEAMCGPIAGIGGNAGNKGIGEIIDAGRGFRYTIIDSDPQSATFGTHSNSQQDGATAQPAAGFYVRGAFVKNTSLALVGTGRSAYIIRGWERITTGSAHVAGTDWVEVRVFADAGVDGTPTNTVTIQGLTTPGAPTYTIRDLSYSQYRNRCEVQIRVQLSAKGTMAGAVAIGGLPFNSVNRANSGASFAISRYSGVTLTAGYTELAAMTSPNSGLIILYQNGSGMSPIGLDAANISATTEFALSGHYEIA